MGVLLHSTLAEILCGLVLIAWLLYFYLTKNYNYWYDRGVPCKRPEFPFGSTKDIVLTRTTSAQGHQALYEEFYKERYYGIINFRKPTFVVKDPELIKRVMVKDFQHFVDRPRIIGNPKEYIMMHLLNLTGQEWKDMRAKLTPTFTSGKMKLMFSLMEKCSESLKAKLESEIVKKEGLIEAKDLLARFTMEIIASCAFGIDTNTLTEENAKFYKVFGGTLKTTPLRYIRRVILILFPSILHYLRINLIRAEIREFITNLIRETIDYRLKNNVKRNDFMDLLINISKDKNEVEENGYKDKNDGLKDGLTVEQMAAQTFVFFIAGFETASSLMAFCLYELACHKDIQEQLFQEIHKALDKNEGKMSYQVLMEIPFLDQVINEALRMYGTGQTLSRECTKPYPVPDSELVLEKGLSVTIPLYAIHHDPQYYPDPDCFKPERFSPEQSKNRHPFVFMPFGEGPRNCIGMRFGLMEAKVGLATVLLNFHIDLSPEQEVPIELDTRSITLQPAHGVKLRISKRNH